MDVAEKFIRSLVQKDRKHVVFADGAIWYPQACNVFRLKHDLHSPFKKSLVQLINTLRIELKVLMTAIHVFK